MTATSFVLTVDKPIVELGAVPGDRIVVEPDHRDPVTIIRSIPPAYGALAAALRLNLLSSPLVSTPEALERLQGLTGHHHLRLV